LHWQFIYRYGTHTAQESGSPYWCHAVMNLRFAVHSCPLFPAEANCETGKRILLSLVFTS